MTIRIDVSHEMLAFVGGTPDRWPLGWIGFGFDLADGTFAVAEAVSAPLDAVDVVLLVSREACRRIFAATPAAAGAWHLPSDVRQVALALRDCALPEPARTTLRLAKSIELLCATFAALSAGRLVPVDAAGELSAEDARRIVAARRLIDERWHEKLTLVSIASACGINRAKLTRGFRAMFDCSIADALAERRLGGARTMLLSTDLPVGSVGYACGYLNNAAFARAFTRRFGVAPSRLRAAA